MIPAWLAGSWAALLFAVSFDVMLGSVLRVFGGVHVMAVGQMRVVGCGFVIALGVMPGGFMVMARSVLVVFRCLGVMLSCFVRHKLPLVCRG